MQSYLASIETSIISRKLGNAKKHNEQIMEHNRLKPNTHTHTHTNTYIRTYTHKHNDYGMKLALTLCGSHELSFIYIHIPWHHCMHSTFHFSKHILQYTV